MIGALKDLFLNIYVLLKLLYDKIKDKFKKAPKEPIPDKISRFNEIFVDEP
jgi:hypothetical protein